MERFKTGWLRDYHCIRPLQKQVRERLVGVFVGAVSVELFRRCPEAREAFLSGDGIESQDCLFCILSARLGPINFLLSSDSFQEMILQSTPPPQKNGVTSELGVRRVDAPNEYFMPTSSDRFVLAFRQWLNKYAGEAAFDVCMF